jgi:hypothetical protein
MYCAVALTRLTLRHALQQNKAASVFMRHSIQPDSRNERKLVHAVRTWHAAITS